MAKISDFAAYAREQLSDLVEAAAFQATADLKELTPVRVVRKGEDPDPTPGRLRNSWQTDVQGLSASVLTNLEYAEPVVTGENLPPSWGGEYRTRQGAVPFLDIVAKDTQTFIEREARIIAEQS